MQIMNVSMVKVRKVFVSSLGDCHTLLRVFMVVMGLCKTISKLEIKFLEIRVV